MTRGDDKLEEIVRYAKRPTLWCVVACVGACVVLAFAAAPAFAGRSKLSPITEANSRPFGGLSSLGVAGVAVDDSDNLWIGETGGQVIDEVSSSGAFVGESTGSWSGLYPQTVAFSDASKHLYFTDFFSGDIWGLEPSGAYAGIDLTGPWSAGYLTVGIAADNSSGPTGGDLYLAGEGSSVYRIDGAGGEVPFSASEPYIGGNRLTGFAPGESFYAPVAIAVASTGDFYVVDAGRDAVYEFSSSGEFLRSFAEAENGPFGSVSAIAVDPTNGHVLVADQANGFIDEFDSTGTYLDNLEEVSGPTSLAVDSSGKLYVTESAGNQIGVYGPYSAPLHLPKIEGRAVSSVASTSATLNASVKPKGGGEVSECRFEYGSSESYGQSVPCAPATFSSTSAVSAQLRGLLHDRTYHYRLRVVDTSTGFAGLSGLDHVFATNPAAAGSPTAGCSNPARTGPSVRLPDCRGYELLTPADKGDAEDMFGDTGEQSVNGGSYEVGYPDENPLAEGGKFFLSTTAAFGPGATGGQNGYVFSRDAGGWQQDSLAAPIPGVQSVDVESLFSPNFSHVASLPKLGSNANAGAKQSMGLVGLLGGPYDTIFEGNEGTFTGASTDFTRVFFQSADHSFAAPAGEQLVGSKAVYEYSGGRYTLINVDDEGKLLNECGAVSPAENTQIVGVYSHAVSADGSRVFFLSPDPTDLSCFHEREEGFTGSPPQLFVRMGRRTVEMSAPVAGVVDPAGPQPVAFAGAAADGSRVFFITREELTADDAGNHAPELYEYDFATEGLTRISRGASKSGVGNVSWVVPAASGAAIYYTTANGHLYRYDTHTGTTTYITTVSGGDWNETNASGYKTLNVHQPLNVRSSWEATPDGRFLLFIARENVTGYDSAGHSEVYRFDAVTGGLLCISCNPDGSAPSADAQFDRTTRNREVRGISDDGAFVFFDTPESLVPADTNGRLDVYEWHEGGLSLISSGQDASNSYFLGTDPSGGDVFFGTHARLAPQDVDGAGDLYDARINGGFPVVQGAMGCEGDGCRNPSPTSSGASGEAGPLSFSFTGPGNWVAPKPPAGTQCKKGVKKHGKCVRVRKKRVRARKAGHNGRAR